MTHPTGGPSGPNGSRRPEWSASVTVTWTRSIARLSPGSTSYALADQDSVIVQTLQGVANATTDQTSSIEQGETAPTGGDGA